MKIEIDHAEIETIIRLIRHDDHPLLRLILEKVTSIMASNAELLAALNTLNSTVTDIGTEVDKIGTETAALVKSVADLATALANGQTTPEVDAALALVQSNTQSLAARVKTVDDLVPDAPVTP